MKGVVNHMSAMTHENRAMFASESQRMSLGCFISCSLYRTQLRIPYWSAKINRQVNPTTTGASMRGNKNTVLITCAPRIPVLRRIAIAKPIRNSMGTAIPAYIRVFWNAPTNLLELSAFVKFSRPENILASPCNRL